METDECGAAEFFSNGAKLLRVPGENGKIDPNAVARTVTQRSSIPYPGPKAILITRSTELGAFYSLDELGAVKDLA